jgi:hypothetical protein
MIPAQFTSGPWAVAKGNTGFINVQAGPFLITPRWTGTASPEELEANARLIAAAPRLFELLERALWAIDKSGGFWGGEDAARALIAEVRGEQVSA